MKTLLSLVCSVVLALSLAGCAGKAPIGKGKGKAPPVVVTKG